MNVHAIPRGRGVLSSRRGSSSGSSAHPPRGSRYLLLRLPGVSLLLAALLSGAVTQAAAPPHALILFDSKQEAKTEGPLAARYIANLLGHFELPSAPEIRPLEQYRAGDAQRYDIVFFASVAQRTTEFPAGFLEDASSGQRPFVWLGRNIGGLLNAERAQRLGFRYREYSDEDEFTTVTYRNLQLAKPDKDLSLVNVIDGNRVKVHAISRSTEVGTYPYALQSGNFWYFADCPFPYTLEGSHFLVFADLLHDILGQPHPASRRAMVRIEDVSVDDDPDDLRAVADYLYSQRVPFQIALIPIFRDPERGLEIYMSDRRQFIDALHYMVARGGSVVLHGITHQYRGTSGDDFEFWNKDADKPVPNDGQREALEHKLDLAFRECFRNGIYPIAWETPHNAASSHTYNFLKDYFSLFHERELIGPALASESLFPYPLRDIYGRYVVSENLGYLPVEKSDPRPIVEAARAMGAVRDGISIFYFHPFMKLEYLKSMVSGIRGLGCQFISLREFAPRVRFRQWEVAVAGSDGQTPAPPSAAGARFLRRVAISPDGQTSESTLTPAEAAAAGNRLPPGTLVAWEPTNTPAARPPSLLARLRQWLAGLRQARAENSNRQRGLPPVALLWNPAARGPAATEQQSFEALFQTYGYPVERVSFNTGPAQPGSSGAGEATALPALAPDRLLAIPASVAPHLSPGQQATAVAHLRAGGRLLLAGRSRLAEQLGLVFSGRSIRVKQVSDLEYPEQNLKWEPEEKVERFEPPDGHVPLMLDVESRQALAFSAEFDQGKYVYLSTPLDVVSGLGVARYPYLINHLQEVFSARPRLSRPRLEAYFDPGYRQDIKDWARLVNSWRKTGIRIVYVAAWHKYPKWEWDYRGFIQSCHRTGIAVYAWFEFPMITQSHWNEHPEWREKTASGEDAQSCGATQAPTNCVSWRYLLNLRNPNALKAAKEFFRQQMAYDWDGLNIAELNFDASDSPENPHKYVPMNADVRRDFAARHGFDPIELFNPESRYYWRSNPAAFRAFTDYRVALTTSLHEEFLQEAEQLRRKRDLEVMVTVMDSLHSKTLRTTGGIDSREIVKLMDRYPFTLQVQDPSEFWAGSPDRYRDFGRTYLGLVKDPSRLMFDVNVIPDRSVAGSWLPSQVATGAEFARLLAAASAPTGRAVIYSEASVPAQDWELAGSVLAAGARIWREAEGWRIDTPHAVAVRVATDRTGIYLDGRAWPAFEAGSVLVPPGRHLLTFSRPLLSLLEFHQLDLRLRSITGELRSAQATSRGMVFNYQSQGRCVAVFNKQPYSIRVDGRQWPAAPLYSPPQDEWSLILPGGQHSVAIVNAPAVFAVEWTSVWFSTLIVVFGLLSSGAMIGLYVFIRVRRSARELRRRGNGPVPEVLS